jgi:glucoamylase
MGGVGRAWPLLAGERGHYELAAGRPREAERMVRLMEASATSTGLIPEQVWDADDLPEKGLCRGRPTTSACPLVWAHAEYVKLRRSLRDGAVFDLPRQTVRRYGKRQA